MKRAVTLLPSVFLLTLACCNMQANPEKTLVLVDLDPSKSPSSGLSKLSPALLAIKTSGGILKASDGSGRVVIALPADTLSSLKKQPFVKSVTSDVPSNLMPITRLKISYEAGNAPTAEDLRMFGLKMVESYEKGSFLIAEPRDGLINAQLISNLELNPKIRYVTPVLHINAALSDKS